MTKKVKMKPMKRHIGFALLYPDGSSESIYTSKKFARMAAELFRLPPQNYRIARVEIRELNSQKKKR